LHFVLNSVTIRNVRRKGWLSLTLAAVILLSTSAPLQAGWHQQDDAAARLLALMPPAARVGQLFIVTFPGTDTSELSPIYDLIVEERIGGVLLRPANGNILNEGNTPVQVATLTNQLQQLAWDASQLPLETASEGGRPTTVPFIPLFIAVKLQEEGDPYTAVISGTTPLPTPMAIGATWNQAHAETTGAILGEELNALGINMLLGPSLDVLNTPRPTSPADLGVRSFGGDPYWVGQMGRAYIRGIHTGSEGRIAVIPGHFPGLGAADRPLFEEVSTVQKSLEQLKQIELAPFFAVAGAEDPLARPDGLLVSHIRYRGFQGNIYASTKPVSFDPQALQQLMSLPELEPWRGSGGLTVADELGVRAVRRFYDPTEQEFNARRIAREAFLAGNDLLILSHFALTDDWESQIANIRATIAFFREKYETDPTFQARVDEAVLRILRLKLHIYGSFTLNGTLVDADAAADLVGGQEEQVAPIARDAVTLLSPPSPDLRPPPPAADERIVIFTDDRLLTPCAGCAPTYAIPPTLLEETLIRLYGPHATYQIVPAYISSFTFSQLTDYLTTPPSTPESGTPSPPSPVEAALEQADWVIFAMLDITDQVPTSNAVRHFLAEQVDLLKDKEVVVFAFGAPYYLDTTEIAKLSAYFGLYSHTTPFVEAAFRALFDEFPFIGAPPVSVAGINYDLIVQTQPDPSQTIQIFYRIGEEPTEEGEATQTPQPMEVYQGDTLRLWTSVILDRNGHPVPDGTPVEFIFTYPQEGLEHTVQKTTRNGVAETEVTLERVGQLQVSVRAEPHPGTVGLEMDIREGEPAIIVTVTPTPSPVPLPTPTVSPTATPETVLTPAEEVNADEGEVSPPSATAWADLALGLAGAAVVACAGYIGEWGRRRDIVNSLRVGLWCAAGGLLGYIAFAVGLPGAEWVHQQAGRWAAGAAALAGAVITLAVLLVGSALRGGGPPQDGAQT